jgi:hypothetical protein
MFEPSAMDLRLNRTMIGDGLRGSAGSRTEFVPVRELNSDRAYMSPRDEVLELLLKIPWPPNERVRTRATQELVSGFTQRTGLVLPATLCDWLAVVNGSRIGPGGVLGIRSDDPACDIEAFWNVYPGWRTNGWIPIAGDGCGNFYVVLANVQLSPVYFVEAVADDRTLAYVVASGIWEFLRFLFKSDLGETAWPFQRDFVIQHDPLIMETTGAPLPWNS